MLTSKSYLLGIFCLSLAIVSAVTGFNFWADRYGLYRSTRDRKLSVFYDERVSKYLFSMNYVQENFEVVLVGSSSCGNLDFSAAPFPLYNLSIDGGNVSESAILVQNILDKPGRVRALLLGLSPYFLKNSGSKTSAMVGSQYWSGLGSIGLLKVARAENRVSAGTEKKYYNENGCFDFNLNPPAQDPAAAISEAARKGDSSGGSLDMRIDPRAFSEADQLLRRARARGLKVFVFYPPCAEPRSQALARFLPRFFERTGRILKPGEMLTNFQDERWESFRQDTGNFRDLWHLSRRGADIVQKALSRDLQERFLEPH